MADLQFVDQHNMVAFLERSDENAEFHQISKQSMMLSKSMPRVDGKTVVISESSVRSDLYFNDEDDAHTRFETASKKSYDPPLSKGNTSRSGEDSMEHPVDLTNFVPPTPYDSPLSEGHTPGSDEDLVIQKLKKRVKRLEKVLRARTPGMKLFKIDTSRTKGLDKENVSKQRRKSDKTKPMFNDSDFDVLDDAMENVEGGSTAEQITTAGDTLNTASINVSCDIRQF
ncbi:hypothetical protein Tco_0262355 [Tanacetum coccineum]